MRQSILILSLGLSVYAWGQNTPTNPQSSNSQTQSPSTTDAAKPGWQNPKLTPPRSDSVDASAIPDDGQSSSRDTQIDLSPPAGDQKSHPNGSEILNDEGSGAAGEIHPWDPHKAAKDVEVGDFYFKRKNYKAAEDRYREALTYKDNDAIATYRLAVCLEKMGRPDDAREEFESYLRILPHGPQAEEAKKEIERLKAQGPETKATK